MFSYIPRAARVNWFHIMLEGPKLTACLCPITNAADGRAHTMCNDMHLDR